MLSEMDKGVFECDGRHAATAGIGSSAAFEGKHADKDIPSSHRASKLSLSLAQFVRSRSLTIYDRNDVAGDINNFLSKDKMSRAAVAHRPRTHTPPSRVSPDVAIVRRSTCASRRLSLPGQRPFFRVGSCV